MLCGQAWGGQELSQPPEDEERPGAGPPREPPEETYPTETLALGFRPPELREAGSLLLEAVPCGALLQEPWEGEAVAKWGWEPDWETRREEEGKGGCAQDGVRVSWVQVLGRVRLS